MDDLECLRDKLIEKLDADGVEYDRVEINEEGLAIHRKDGEVFQVRSESPEEALQQVLDEQDRKRAAMEQLMLNPLAWAMVAARHTPAEAYGRNYGRRHGRHYGLNGRTKHDKARAKRKKMKQHKKRRR